MNIPLAPKPTCLEGFYGKSLDFRRPKTFGFHGFGGISQLVPGTELFHRFGYWASWLFFSIEDATSETKVVKII